MNHLASEKKSLWQKAKVANLIRYVPSEIYFARVRIRGKLIRKSLEANVFSVAQGFFAVFRGNPSALEGHH